MRTQAFATLGFFLFPLHRELTMTIESTLPPTKEAPYFKCSNDTCNNLWQPYHGKVGCLCYLCDDKTPEYVAKTKPRKGLITNE